METSTFSINLIPSLEHKLSMAQLVPDLENIIGSLNGLYKNSGLSEEDKNHLKRLRQKAYDRKRAIKLILGAKDVQNDLQTSADGLKMELNDELPLQSNEFSAEIKNDDINRKYENNPLQTKKSEENFLNFSLPATLIIALMTGIVGYLVWLQSVDLYKSTFFKLPELAATGALIMVLVFAAYYAITRTWFSLMLCFYVGGYEAYFMITATVHDENMQTKTRVEESSEIVFLRDKAENTRNDYLAAKSRYENPNSKVYKNDWYKKTVLNPAWDNSEKASSALFAKQESTAEVLSFGNIVLLKIMYRIGLILMAMVLIHNLVSAFAPVQPKR